MGGMPLTYGSKGNCIVGKGKAAVMQGGKPTNGINQLMLNPKKFAELTGKDNLAELLKGYKKTDWYKAGIPE